MLEYISVLFRFYFLFDSYYSGRGKIIAASKLWYQFFLNCSKKFVTDRSYDTIEIHSLYGDKARKKYISCFKYDIVLGPGYR